MKIARADCTLNSVGHALNLRNRSRHNQFAERDAATRRQLGPLKRRQNHRRGEGHNAVPS